jgi:tetraacyldisaccharide 4'-kinase
MVVVNGRGMPGEFSSRLRPRDAVNLVTGERRPVSAFSKAPVHAVAGIGNPPRFFGMLEQCGLTVKAHAFPDHHPFTPADLAFSGSEPLLMTEKDAVKCETFAEPDFWAVPVEAEPDAEFVRQFTHAVEELVGGQETARDPGMSHLQR